MEPKKLEVQDVAFEKSQSKVGGLTIDYIKIIFKLEGRDEPWIFTKEGLREALLMLRDAIKI